MLAAEVDDGVDGGAVAAHLDCGVELGCFGVLTDGED